jgi:hypothetical protein
MGTQLDLDDVVADNPLAKIELAQLRKDVQLMEDRADTWEHRAIKQADELKSIKRAVVEIYGIVAWYAIQNRSKTEH